MTDTAVVDESTGAPARAPRADKVAEVESIAAAMRDAGAVLVTEYRGLSVADMQTLRRGLREASAEYRIVKCTLAKIAARDAGVAEIDELLVGPVGLVFVADDVAAAAKSLTTFAKENEAFVIKGGVLQGQALSTADVKAIADLPSRDVLLSQIAGLLQAPAQNVANLVAAPLVNVANLLDALESKRAGEAA